MKNYFTLATLASIASVLSFSAAPQANAHCQVPCGIYSDDTVLIDLKTHQKTIAKAMDEINTLSKDPSQNAHQLTRWVNNKEEHATKIQDTMCQYFLAQRLKLAEGEANVETYQKKLALIHKIIVYAMRCKQKTDVGHAQKLNKAIDEFTKAYKASK